jgi:hypothetical protein
MKRILGFCASFVKRKFRHCASAAALDVRCTVHADHEGEQGQVGTMHWSFAE